MLKRNLILPAIGAAVALSACAGAPKFREADYVRMESLFFAVEQELCRSLFEVTSNERLSAALAEAGIDPMNQYAKATVSLRLAQVTGIDGSVDFVIPITAGVAAAGLSAGVTGQKLVDTSVSVYYPFTELECADGPKNPPPAIEGGLGLWQWVLNTTVALINVRETPAAYSYQVTFSIFRDAGGRPSFSVATGTFPRLGGSLGVGASSEISHTLNVTVRDVTLGADGKAVPPHIRDELDREESLTILRRIRE
jgi:hypothetical protein